MDTEYKSTVNYSEPLESRDMAEDVLDAIITIKNDAANLIASIRSKQQCGIFDITPKDVAFTQAAIEEALDDLLSGTWNRKHNQGVGINYPFNIPAGVSSREKINNVDQLAVFNRNLASHLGGQS